MADILIRATPSPLEAVGPSDIWKLNAYHNNSGNVAFPFGLFRHLTTGDRNVVSDWYGARLPEPEEVNERFDMYVLPMANDFGGHFAGEMLRMAKFIEKLKIPVVIVGIGGAFGIDDSFDSPKPFDDTARRFINAVLERSSKIGLRGEITGRYLTSLGYKEDRDFQVIGDPTLYNLGSTLKIKPFSYHPDMRIAYNMTPKAPQAALRFLNSIPDNFENTLYVPQDLGDFSKLYAGMMDVNANPHRDTVDNYPNSLTDSPFRTGRMSFFTNAPSWIEEMKEYDLSIGTRIHGNILPTHAGTPSLTLMYGSRLKELADYHHLPRKMADSIDPDISLEELVSDVDFHEPEKFHAENFARFVSFLDENEMTHSYRQAGTNAELPFDAALKQVEVQAPIGPVTALNDLDEIRSRLALGHDISREKVIAQKARLKRMKAEIQHLKAENKALRREKRDALRLAAGRTPRGIAGRAKRKIKSTLRIG